MESRSEERLEALVADCLEALDGDDTRTLDQVIEYLTDKEPALRDPLRKRLDRLRDLGLLGDEDKSATQPVIEGYQLRSCLGSGGMGEVWLATQVEPVHRAVAVKVIRRDRRNERVVQRFLSERQALAKMSHPGIAQVYDAGETKTGEPYFAMEFVDGRPIDEVHRSNELGLDTTLELMAKVCDAVQHAHDRGVLHRDLKPQNILVTEIDGELQPKVIDFGLAKGLEESISGGDVETLEGQVLGTPQYMAPEQADSSVDEVDVRVDVYGIGAVLFEMVTGSLPIDIPNATLLEVVQAIRSMERPALSTRLRERASSDDNDDTRILSRSLASRCRGDLDRILKRALQIDPTLRYGSVTALGTDLRAFLQHRPISATPPTTIYRLRKFAKRRRGLFLTAVAVLLTALTGLGFALHYEVQARRSLSWFDKLAEREEVARLIGRVDSLGPLGPSGLSDLESWLLDAEVTLTSRDAAADFLGETRRRAANPEAQDVVDRGYDRGRYAVLDESLTLLLDDLDTLHESRSEVERWTRFARSVPAVNDPTLRARWDEALESIADRERCPLYEGLRLKPQSGLIPLRQDPDSGLWEFALYWPDGESGSMDIPSVGANGFLEVTESTAPVVVLIPGGSFFMGSEVRPEAEFFDEFASNDEDPRHPITLAPFFIGKYELTQAQWVGMTTKVTSQITFDFNERNPGARLTDVIDGRHPVENLSWEESRTWLRRLGLDLPTEAQWEYAARAKTTTPWWCGADRSSVVEPLAANLADERAVAQQYYTQAEPGLEDGYLFHGPVDLGAPNPFGLHGTIGNVWEWVRDRYHFYDKVTAAPDTGLRKKADEESNGDIPRVVRGGGFDAPATKARHTQRLAKGQTDRSGGIGLRLCRAISVTED
ncbi:MAG: bifunctional serine/threonine-protein kinase/formylglycine-generating enzyme family protein [Planctomycetota bacterium]